MNWISVKKHRGKKPENEWNFTRKISRAAEVFDLIGRFTPITARIKLDLSELSLRGLNWDNIIPDDLVPQWRNNFATISKLGEIKFRVAIVPEDAVNLEMETCEIWDSSLDLAFSAVYARFKRKMAYIPANLFLHGLRSYQRAWVFQGRIVRCSA